MRFDITEEIRQEEEMKEQIEQMQAQEEEIRQNMEEMQAIQEEMDKTHREMQAKHKALDNAALVSETDRKGIITYVNDAFCEVAEYSREELVGQNHNIVRHPDMPKKAFKDMWATIGKGNVWKGKVKNKKKRGGFYWVDATITPVLGENGKPEKYIGVRFDITEEVLQEEKITSLMEQTMAKEFELTMEIEQLKEEIKEKK